MSADWLDSWRKRGLRAAIFPGNLYSRDPISGFKLPSTSSQRPVILKNELALWFTGVGLELGVNGIGGVIPTPGSTYPWSATVRYTRAENMTVWSRALSATASSRLLQIYHEATHHPAIIFKGYTNSMSWWSSGSDAHTITLTCNGTTHFAYGDETQESSLSVGSAYEDTQIRLGSRTNTTGYPANGAGISAFLLFDRAISRQEHIELHWLLQNRTSVPMSKYDGYPFLVAGSSYTHPTLSAATLIPAGGNQYQPRVTYTF